MLDGRFFFWNPAGLMLIQPCFVSARRTPRITKRPPTLLRSHVVARDPMFNAPRREEIHARKRHHSVPLRMKIVPRNRKASTLLGADDSMNCGTKARKNRATFGFRTLVRKPCQKTAGRDAAGRVGADVATVDFERSSDSPISRRRESTSAGSPRFPWRKGSSRPLPIFNGCSAGRGA